ncbi:MAG: ABC transporter substrate-binding protein [Chloroflexi bacterium]|nr:ABC transporter substrate-binding protein [Chloroflexota bacterium]
MNSTAQVPARAGTTAGTTLGTTRRQVVLAGTAAVVLAACGEPGTPDGSAGEASARLGPNGFTFKQPVQLTYWKSLEGPRHEAQVKLTDDFNASRSDVKVTLEHVGVYAQAAEKLTAVLAADTPPDVMLLTVDTHMPGFARMGALHPLDEFAKVDKSAKFETYAPGFIKNGTINGKLYQIPLARSTPVLYFNKDHLRAAGLPEAAPNTWDQVVDVAQKLTRAAVMQPDSADGSKVALPVAGYWWPFQSAVWAFGGKLSDDKFTPTVTQPETVQAMQFFADLVQRHRVARAYRTVGPSSTAFQQGQLSFLVESTAVLTQVEERTSARVGAAFMPQQKQRAVPGGGSGLTIINSIPVEKKEAGWEFMKFVTSTPNTVYFSKMTGYMVVRTDAEKNAEFQQYLKEHPNAKVTFDQMQFVRTQDSIAEVPGAPAAIEGAIREVAMEGKNVKTVMDELQRKLTSLAQEARK